MRNIVLIALREFRQRVRSRGFIIGSFSVPLLMIIFWFFTGMFDSGGQDEPDIDALSSNQEVITTGVVDQADLVQFIPEDIPEDVLLVYENEDAAKIALEEGAIVAYYVVPDDYRQTGDVVWVSDELPVTPPTAQWINWVLVTNLFPDANAEQIGRYYTPFGGYGPQFVSLKEVEESNGGLGSDNFMLPFIVTIAVMIPLFTSGSYLLQSVTQEKSSRIMEILLVSIRPLDMLVGKLIGLGVLTLVQYLIWGSIAGIAVLVTGRDLTTLLQGISLTGSEILLVLPYALGGFLLYAGIMAGVGALSPDLEGSRGWVFIISLPMMIPIYVWVAIVQAPNGPLAVALSMIPFSAPIAMMMRMTSTTVPAWQMAGSLALLVLTAVGFIWLMARLFRVQTLLSGEKPSLKRFIAALQD